MRVIDLDGSAYERGLAQGEATREAFEALMSDLLEADEFKTHGPPITSPWLLRRALSAVGRGFTQSSVRRRLPAQAQRVRGLAKGLGVSHGTMWGAQFLEVVFCEAGSTMVPPGPNGCTLVTAGPRATANGGLLTGRNYDFPYMLAAYQVVRREIPSERDRLATTTATQVALAGAHQGVNEAGLAMSTNNARLWRGEHLRYRGVPGSFLLQEVLETCKTAAEAMHRVLSFGKRATAGFMGIADASGEAMVVEFTASEATVRRPGEHGVLAQANHFTELSHCNVPDGTLWAVEGMEDVEYLAGSHRRQRTALQMLEEQAGSISVETLEAILSDHAGQDEGGEDTVCCHGHTGGTLASMVVDVTDRSLWIADGSPCSVPYEHVPFRARQR
jgi:isopenicillin-N N-acyltransferase-like protein